MDRKLAETPGSDEWWIKRLFEKLVRQGREASKLRAWDEGTPPLPVPDNQRPAWERLQRIASVNLARLIVDARLHRLNLKGASTSLDDSPNGDDVLSSLFVELDVQRKVHQALRFALAEDRGFLMLTGDGDLRVSDAMHAAVETDAEGRTVAALSIYRDDPNDRDVAILARPGYFRVAYKGGNSVLPRDMRSWMMAPDSWEFQPRQPSGLDFIPAYELEPPGGSLIKAHLPSLERINHGILQRMIIIAMQAFRQRAMKGLPDRDEEGNEIDYDGAFPSAPDALWMLPEGVDLWESGQADLTPVLSAVKDDIRFLAAASKTPLFMISPDDANGSAEGAATQREILIFDIESIIAAFGGPLKRMLSDLLTIRGEIERANLTGIRLIWANPRRSSLNERAASALAAKQAGIPSRFVFEKFAEMEPDEVEAAMRDRDDDVFAQAAASAEVAP